MREFLVPGRHPKTGAIETPVSLNTARNPWLELVVAYVEEPTSSLANTVYVSSASRWNDAVAAARRPAGAAALDASASSCVGLEETPLPSNAIVTAMANAATARPIHRCDHAERGPRPSCRCCLRGMAAVVKTLLQWRSEPAPQARSVPAANYGGPIAALQLTTLDGTSMIHCTRIRLSYMYFLDVAGTYIQN